MGICRNCKKEMMDLSVTTCEANASVEYPDGKALQAVPYDPRKLHLPQLVPLSRLQCGAGRQASFELRSGILPEMRRTTD